MVTPRVGLTTLPYVRIWSTSPLTESMGIANPTPEEAPLPANVSIIANYLLLRTGRCYVLSSDASKQDMYPWGPQLLC